MAKNKKDKEAQIIMQMTERTYTGLSTNICQVFILFLFMPMLVSFSNLTEGRVIWEGDSSTEELTACISYPAGKSMDQFLH